MNRVTDGTNTTEQALHERAWLVRLCARLTGAPDVAEDLAQETLLEAWRHAHKLADPAGRARWLAAIARNICLRWRRRHWQTAARLTTLELDESLADPYDCAAELEHRDLVALIGRALALLPASTRELLVARYLHDLPYRTIAERLGLSEDAVAMRLSRGRRHLHQVLTTELQAALLTYDAAVATSETWEATRLWCQLCGQHRLLARLPPASATVAFRCPGCKPDPAIPGAVYPLANRSFAHLLGGLRRPKVILRRAATWAHPYFHQALAEGSARCTHCDRVVALHTARGLESRTSQAQPPFLYLVCDACGTAVSTSFHGLIMTLPEVHAFWQAQRRIRKLSDYDIDVAGQVGTVIGFESLTSAARLDIIALRDPLCLLNHYQAVQRLRSA